MDHASFDIEDLQRAIGEPEWTQRGSNHLIRINIVNIGNNIDTHLKKWLNQSARRLVITVIGQRSNTINDGRSDQQRHLRARRL